MGIDAGVPKLGHPKHNDDFEVVRKSLKAAGAAGEGKYEHLTLTDGSKMFLQYWLPEGKEPERVLVALHGAGAHGWYFALMADALAPKGIAVYSPDHRNHGLSDGLKGDMPNSLKILEDVKTVVSFVRAKHPKAKIFTIGESMGGIININYVMDNQDGLTGMALLAPAVKPPATFSLVQMLKLPFYLFALIVSRKWRVIKMYGEEHIGMRNPDNIKYDRNDPLHLKYVSTRYMLGIKKLMDRAAKGGAEKIKVPALVVQGGADRGVNPKGTREFFNKLPSADKEFVFYPNAFHCMMSDPDCADLFDRIHAWMEAH